MIFLTTTDKTNSRYHSQVALSSTYYKTLLIFKLLCPTNHKNISEILKKYKQWFW